MPKLGICSECCGLLDCHGGQLHVELYNRWSKPNSWNVKGMACVPAVPLCVQPWMVHVHRNAQSAYVAPLQDAVDKGWLRQEVNGPPDLLAVVITAHEIASGLQHLHQQGIVHGDLSAFNIMLSTKGQTAQAGARGFTAKVADFGEWALQCLVCRESIGVGCCTAA